MCAPEARRQDVVAVEDDSDDGARLRRAKPDRPLANALGSPERRKGQSPGQRPGINNDNQP